MAIKLQKSGSPDVFMRNHVTDTGVVPFQGKIVHLSPDIIAMENLVIDPAQAFGGANWNEPFLDKHIVRVGSDNYIYGRVANRGTEPVYASLSLYWGLSNQVTTPGNWTRLARIKVPNLLPQERRVVGPIVWSQDKNPGTGSYFMTAIVTASSDPLSLPGPFPTMSQYYDFLRENNNICHRNIAILPVGGTSLPL
jgi:hypothetical protein